MSTVIFFNSNYVVQASRSCKKVKAAKSGLNLKLDLSQAAELTNFLGEPFWLVPVSEEIE